MPVNDLLGFETVVPVGVCTVSTSVLPDGTMPVLTQCPTWANAMANFWLQTKPRAIVHREGSFTVIGRAGPIVPTRPGPHHRQHPGPSSAMAPGCSH